MKFFQIKISSLFLKGDKDMKNKFTLFEKITMTVGIGAIFLFVIGLFEGASGGNGTLAICLMLPLAIQLIVTFFLFLLYEVILNKIWGIDIHIFPTIFDNEEIE